MPLKKRHNPEKPQNKYGTHCSYDDGLMCELYISTEALKICKGNRHNCKKVEAKLNAIEKNKR